MRWISGFGISAVHDWVWTDLESLRGAIDCCTNGSDLSDLPNAITPWGAVRCGIGYLLDFLAQQPLWIGQQSTPINGHAPLAPLGQQLLCRKGRRLELAVRMNHLGAKQEPCDPFAVIHRGQVDPCSLMAFCRASMAMESDGGRDPRSHSQSANAVLSGSMSLRTW